MAEHSTEPPFNPGDRVWLLLPTDPPSHRRGRHDGTVTAVGHPLQNSVRVDLDEACCGLMWITASDWEVHHA